MNTTTRAAAYLRRSYVDAQSPGDISLEAQRAAVARLAAADGFKADLAEYQDWGISADHAKRDKRTEYDRLLADMEVGAISAVYAFDVDRLYRDPRDLQRLQDAAARHGVRVVTTGGPLPIGETDDPAAEAFAFMGAVWGRMELQKAKKRARASVEARRASGAKLGQARYGFRLARDEGGVIREVRNESVDLDLVRTTYLRERSLMRTAKALNAMGIPSPKNSIWRTFTVGKVIRDQWPELLPPKSPGGRRRPPAAMFSGMLRCHCGTILTANRGHRGYYCHNGHSMGKASHGKTNIAESKVREFIMDEATRMHPPEVVEVAQRERTGRHEALIAEKARVGEAYQAGAYTAERMHAELARIDAELATIEEEIRTYDLRALVSARPARAIDWVRDDPAVINEMLRTGIRAVQLDADLMPVHGGVEWTFDIEAHEAAAWSMAAGQA